MSGGTKRFLDPAQLAEAATQVVELSRIEGIKIALLGGYAMQLYGSDRLTGDLDFVADQTLESLPVEKPLTFGGQRVRAPNGVEVDLIVRADEYAKLYEEALERAHTLPGVPGRVVRPEHLAAMKMAAQRPRDDADLAFLITSGAIDRTKTRAFIQKHMGVYAAKEFDRTVEEVEWLASKGRI